MPNYPLLLLAGAIAGLIAAWVMEFFQLKTGKLFGQGGGNSDEEPSTVKAAKMGVGLFGQTIAKDRRMAAGRLVHFVTGAGLGIVYFPLALAWPTVTIGFGAAYGIAVAIVLDHIVTSVFGWSPPPWKTPLNTHLYSLASHIVFGLALEALRQISLLL